MEYGTTIYKTVHADGYYDDRTNCADCDRYLVKSPYQFIEFCVDDARNKNLPANESGCLRISAVPKEAGVCDERINSKNERRAALGEPAYAEFSQNQCLLLEEINRPIAEYGLLETYEASIVDEQHASEIRRSL